MVLEKVNYRSMVQHVYNSFNARNIDAAFEVIHRDANWANTMEGGLLHGHEEIRAYWLRQWTYIDWHVKFVDASLNDAGNVLVNTHQIIRDFSGNIVTLKDVQHIFTIEDGMIQDMRIP